MPRYIKLSGVDKTSTSSLYFVVKFRFNNLLPTRRVAMSLLRVRSIQMLPLVMSLIMGCENSGSPTQAAQYWFYSRDWGNAPLSNQRVVSIRNPLGDVVITGGGSPSSTCGWYLFKTAEAQSTSDTAEIFSSINLSTWSSNDTFYVDVVSAASSTAEPSCLVDLSIPYGMSCHIAQANGRVEADDVDSVLDVDNAAEVDVERQSGSCRVAADGDISVLMDLPDSGYCRLSAANGDITLKIPTTTSAALYAKSGDGTVSDSGLVISNLQRLSSLVSGTLNSGQGEIYLKTQKGNVRLVGF